MFSLIGYGLLAFVCSIDVGGAAVYVHVRGTDRRCEFKVGGFALTFSWGVNLLLA